MAALVNENLDYWGAIGFFGSLRDAGSPCQSGGWIFARAPPSALIARTEIKSVQDLKGKILGTSTFGDAPEIIARLVLKHFGLDPDKDVKFLALGAGAENRFAAMKQGLISATVVSVPADSENVKLGFQSWQKHMSCLVNPTPG